LVTDVNEKLPGLAMSKEFAWCEGEACLGEVDSTSTPQFTMAQAVANGARVKRSRVLPIRVPQPKAGRHALPGKKAATPEVVVRSFNTWAFKREQPADPQLMERTVADAVSRGEPVSFVLYWGKGPRAHVAEPEITCLDFLGSLAKRVGEVYAAGATIELIFTDTHAGLNGHAPQTIQQYFAEVRAQAGERGFSTRLLSELTSAAQASAAPLDDEPAPEKVLQHLSTSAGKWYRGAGTARDGALKYYQMNMIEKRAVEFAYPHSIFVTFNGSDLRCLFPDRLPVFYMYSLRRGFSVKPWFLPAAGVENFERIDLP
jgi:L-tyrosine isonitrile synthase